MAISYDVNLTLKTVVLFFCKKIFKNEKLREFNLTHTCCLFLDSLKVYMLEFGGDMMKIAPLRNMRRQQLVIFQFSTIGSFRPKQLELYRRLLGFRLIHLIGLAIEQTKGFGLVIFRNIQFAAVMNENIWPCGNF